MLEIAQSYCEMYGSTEEAIPHFARNLMTGDPETLKAGYTRENAIMAAAWAFGVTREEVERLVA